MAQINKEQKFEREEDNGGGIITQKCEYNSTSDWISIETNGQKLSLPILEWRMMISLIDECLKMKGDSL